MHEMMNQRKGREGKDEKERKEKFRYFVVGRTREGMMTDRVGERYFVLGSPKFWNTQPWEGKDGKKKMDQWTNEGKKKEKEKKQMEE